MAGFSRFDVVSRHLEQKLLNGKDVTHRNAFEHLDAVEFRIHVPETTVGAEMQIFCDDTGKFHRFEMARDGENFSVTVPMAKLCGRAKGGLFFYKYRIFTDLGAFDTIHSGNGSSESFSAPGDGRGDFQLLVYEKRANPPKWIFGGIFYQIFPDRFFSAGDNPVKEDSVLCRDLKKFPEFLRNREKNNKNNLFFGGDLQGIVEKLDYLASLGVTCLYLNPIFESPSNHKYNTADYLTVDKMLGGEEAFRHLIREVKARGMHIILDGVFNHTGSDSIYFNKEDNYPSVGAAQSEDSPYAKWYTFTRYPDQYESWWGIMTLPRVKCDEPSYRAFLFGEDGVIRRYFREGIDGWRLDVADELSDDFLRELAETAREEKEDALVIGEVWEDATTKISYGTRKKYFQGKELDAVMNYPVQKAIIAYIKNGDHGYMRRTLESVYSNYPPDAANALMNILGTHDTERILTAVGDRDASAVPYQERGEHRMGTDRRRRAVSLMKLAVAIQMSVPGVPCIYYGDEAGLEGYGDPFCRLPYPWGKEDEALLSFYRTITAARRKEKIFEEGTFSLVHADGEILCYERHGEDEVIVVLVNRSKMTYEFRATCIGEEIVSGKTAETHLIEAESFAWVKIPKNADYTVFVQIS